MLTTQEIMEVLARGLNQSLRDFCGKKMGFTLLVFDFEDPGLANYVSNCERGTMIEALKETVARFKEQQSNE